MQARDVELDMNARLTPEHSYRQGHSEVRCALPGYVAVVLSALDFRGLAAYKVVACAYTAI